LINWQVAGVIPWPSTPIINICPTFCSSDIPARVFSIHGSATGAVGGMEVGGCGAEVLVDNKGGKAGGWVTVLGCVGVGLPVVELACAGGAGWAVSPVVVGIFVSTGEVGKIDSSPLPR